MRTTVIGLAIVFLGLTATAQTPPTTLHGFFLGQTFDQYATRFPRTADELSACHETDKKQIAKLNLQGLGLPAPCALLLSAEEGGRSRLGSPGILEITFEHSVVIGIEMTLGSMTIHGKKYNGSEDGEPLTYDMVVSDLVKKFGTPSGQTAVQTQNGFGAQFTQRVTTWKNTDAIVVAGEVDPDLRYPATSIMVETPAEYAKEQAALLNRKGSLE